MQFKYRYGRADGRLSLNDSNEKVRGAAIFALGYLPMDGRAAEALQRIIDNGATPAALHKPTQQSLKYHVKSE